MHSTLLVRFSALLALSSLIVSALGAAEPIAVWQPVSVPAGVTLESAAGARMQIVSTVRDDYRFDSVASLPARPGDCFAVKLRFKAGVDMAAKPELVCYDTSGQAVSPPSAFGRGERASTTNWQTFERVFVAQPGTASVRARILGTGRGTIELEGLELRPAKIDAYKTGSLIRQGHPRNRTGVVLESNFNIVNRELVSTADRDGDGKWALITINLDLATAPEKRGEDWRSNFEDNPNVILWSDGAVLKSDSVLAERVPDIAQALHFRAKVHAGPYNAWVNDPGRPVSVSLDGKTWRRANPGEEISLGTLAAPDGTIEFWLDACHVDAMKAGPAYFDYVRLMPTRDEASINRLLAAARTKPSPAGRGTAEETKVAVSVEAPPFSGARTWPVRCGLPIPRGQLVGATNVAVLGAAGAKIPSQVRVMATWPDGSVRWLFLDFMTDPSNAGASHYTVVYGNRITAAPAARGVQVQRDDSGIEVDTGAIRFRVSSRHFGLIEDVRRPSGQSLQREPLRAEIVETDGRVWNALDLPVAKLEVERVGPLHTVILVETKLADSGKPATGFYHRARIHAFAGSPLVSVDYFVANTDSRPAGDVGGSMASKVMVKSFTVAVRPTAAITGARSDAGAAAGRGARVQKTESIAVDLNGEETKEGVGRVSGWLGVNLDQAGSLLVGVPEFRAQFPKALRWTPQAVQIDLWAPEGGEFSWIEGVGKTHHLELFYGAEPAVDGARLAGGPDLALAKPEWYVGSGALGDITTAAESGEPAIEQSLNSYMTDVVVGRVGLGFENYGDHSSSGYVKGNPLWDNNEYDVPAACLVHFARTGDRAALRLGLASAQHYLDVDTIHYSSQHAAWAQAQHVHSHALFGHHTAQGPDYNHAGYVQGLIWHSYFTGDPAGIEGARGIANWTSRNLSILTGGMERLVGHALMTCNDLYEATGDVKYLRASAALVDQALKWEHPVRSGFLSTIFETPAFYSGCPFDNGVISAGLIKFNDWARLPEVDGMLVRFAQWTLTDTWLAPNSIASKGGSPRKGGSPQHIGNQGRLMARAFGITGDPFFLAAPIRLAELGYGANSKPIPGTRSVGLIYNYLPWLLAVRHEQGDPQPEPQLEVILTGPLTVATGSKIVATVTLKNTGSSPIENLRASMHARLDFAMTALQTPPARLDPGQSVESRYEIQAPANINLSCDYNQIAYAHWSALYQRGASSHFAHRTIKFTIGARPGDSVQRASN